MSDRWTIGANQQKKEKAWSRPITMQPQRDMLTPQLFSEPRTSGSSRPKIYLLFAESPKDEARLASFANLKEEDRKVWIEKLGDKVFLAQFFHPPEETLHWIKTTAEIEGKVGVIEMPEVFYV